MAWATCQNSREDINLAGRQLVSLAKDDPARSRALEIINNWRSCHAYPLTVVKNTLKKRSREKVNVSTLVAQRIKRLSSIALKLQHNPSMRLVQMQDIGGCRAVLNTVSEVEALVRVYEEQTVRHPRADDRPLLIKSYDYIGRPKQDGYRGVHLIMDFHGKTKGKRAYSGQKIEIQVRSKLQHAWATAVETCQTFTGQALKSKIKTAEVFWLRFFALMSSAIAAREKRNIVPGTPESKDERKHELQRLESEQKIVALLEGWNTAVKLHADSAEAAITNAGSYLLELNLSTRLLNLSTYTKDEMLYAQAEYLEREKSTENDPAIQVVLVSADSVANLRRAYPNYYMDTTAFIRAIKQEIA